MTTVARKRAVSVYELHLGRIYTDAVWTLAVQQNRAAELFEEYQSLVSDVLDREPKLELFFGLSSVSRERRDRMISALFQGRASELLMNLLRTLNRHDRLGLLRAIGQCLLERWDTFQGKVPALIRTAVPLADDQVEAVRRILRDQFRIEPDLTTEVVPDLLGGMWVRIGDTVYDRTIRWNLKKLRENLLARSSYEIQSG